MSDTPEDKKPEPDEPDEETARDHEILDKAMNLLMTGFDNAQVFVTKGTGKTTIFYTRSRGNWFANYGFVRMWVDNDGDIPDLEDEYKPKNDRDDDEDED